MVFLFIHSIVFGTVPFRVTPLLVARIYLPCTRFFAFSFSSLCVVIFVSFWRASRSLPDPVVNCTVLRDFATTHTRLEQCIVIAANVAAFAFECGNPHSVERATGMPLDCIACRQFSSSESVLTLSLTAGILVCHFSSLYQVGAKL